MYSTSITPSSAPGRVGPQHCLRLWTRQLVWSIVYNRKQWHPFAITSTTKVALSNLATEESGVRLTPQHAASSNAVKESMCW